MTTEIQPLQGNLPTTPLPFGNDTAAGGAEGMNPLVRLLAALKRFKWLILLTTLVGAGGGYLATRFMVPKYVVNGVIMLEERGGATGPVEAGQFLQGSQWIELLKDPRVLDPVVRELQLYVVGPNPRPGTPSGEGPTGPAASLFTDFNTVEGFIPGNYKLTFTEDGGHWKLQNSTQGPAEETGVVGDSAGRQWGLEWVPKPRQWMFGKEFKFTLLTPREVTNQLADAIDTKFPPRGGRFVRVSYDATDPQRAKATLNAIMLKFVKEAAELKKANLVEQSTALDSQLMAAEQRMTDAQVALQNFKIRTVTQPKEDVPISPGSPMTTSYSYGTYLQMQQTVDSLKRERRELIDALSRTRQGDLTTDQMLSIGAVRSSPDLQGVINSLSQAESELRALQVTLGPEARDIKAKQFQIRTLRDSTLPRYVDAVVARMDRDIQSLDARMSAAQREMRDIPTRTLTEEKLTNDLDLARTTHADVLRRAEQARLQEASSLPDVRILNQAVAPLQASKNRASVILVLGVLAGLGAGLGLAFVLDLMDGRFRYAEQITGGLGLSILGVIPEIRRAKGKAPNAEDAAQVVEAFRTVRLNLAHLMPETGRMAFTITSPIPGDGKSLVASNLALSFAEAGYHTLLIDGDTRRGELHRTFGTERRPGLLDHLAGDATVEATLRPTSHPKLALMPGGSRHRNSPELMGSRRMHELMKQMRERYEVIIVDSPPLAAGIDPFVLGTVTGNLLMVVRVGATDRDLAEAKLQIVDRLPIRLLGAVLNDVSQGMQEYKYYAYSYTYGTSEEDEQAMELPSTTVGGNAALKP